MIKQLLTLLLIFSLATINAQDAFERRYPSDQNFISVDVKQTIGGDYLTLSIPLEENNESTKKANVSRFSPKGDLVWSKEYTFDSTTQVTGSLTLFPNGNFAFTTVELLPVMNKVVTVANRQGDIIWSRAYGRDDVSTTSQYDNAFVIGEETEKLNLFSTVYDDDRNEPYLAGLDSLGNIEWAHVLVNDSLNTNITDVEQALDTGFILSANISDGAAALIKTDSIGNVEWSRSYGRMSALESISFNAVQPTADTGYIVVGQYTRLITENSFEGIVAKLDSLGNPVWAFATESGNADSVLTQLNNVTDLMDSPDVIVAGRSFEPLETDSYLWMMQLKTDSLGGIVWQNRYSDITNFAVNQDGLDAANDGGAVFFSTSNTSQTQKSLPYLTKIDIMGSSSCEDSLSFTLVNLSLETDTLIWETVAVDTVMDRETEEEVFSGFNLPTLQLDQPAPFCEGDPINVTFDATTENAVSYNWMPNGETTPSIVATEPGQYIVDVRIETDICYNLCDTATIQEIGPPMVQIGAIGSLCFTDADTLIANVTGFAETFQWSTGETAPVIFITEEGNYSVEVFNFCGSSTAAIELECIFDFDACFAVPNAFTPDGDSENDTFSALIAEECQNDIRITNLRIWNRWGELVFESTDGSAWDGMQNGKEAPSDAYLYSMEVEVTDEEPRVVNGDITLLR